MADLALLFKRHGYDAIGVDRQARGGEATYTSRLLGRRAVVLGGADGARSFYDESLVERHGAVPPPLAWLLFGRGAVHGLDADQHRDRKLMFLEALSVEKLGGLYAQVRAGLEVARDSWEGQISLYDELVRVYGAAIITWAGVDTDPKQQTWLIRQMAALVDGFGFAGAAYPRAWRARRDLNRWAATLVDDIRAGRSTAPAGSALAEIVRNVDLDARTAGVELLNILRPTVAVAWLGTSAGAALHDLPEWRRRLAMDGDPIEGYAFAQEVRRTTLFVPALAGRARRREQFGGVEVRPGDRLVLDVVGINHDPGVWADPQSFRPDRFLTHEPNAFELVPQGGGHPSGHRCPGESIALSLIAETARALAATEYDVVFPRESDRSRIPTLPPDGLLLDRVAVTSRRS
jgi:fatty-acid peroxygenase